MSLNHENNTNVIILAAGMGTRMKSAKPKVLHEILGKPMLAYIIDAVKGVSKDEPIVIVGSGADQVRSTIGDKARYVLQEPQLGTAHAVGCAQQLLEGKANTVIVANSDFPLIRKETYQALLDEHKRSGSVMTVATVVADDPRGFGRIVRDGKGRIMRIVEDKDATTEEKQIKELNSNPYVFEGAWLWQAIKKVEKSAVGEYYLTDLVKIAYDEGHSVGTMEVTDFEESIGINNRVHLAEAAKVMQKRTNTHWMLEGITMIDPEKVYIEENVTIGRDTILYPEVYLRNGTVIGEACELGPSVIVENSSIGDR